MTRPLEGLKIVDFTHVLAGPFATRVLGDMGADVVRIDRAGSNRPGNPADVMSRVVPITDKERARLLEAQGRYLAADIGLHRYQ